MSIQDTIYSLEKGGSRNTIIMAGIAIGFLVLAGTYYTLNFTGFRHAEAMDAAQVARNVAQGKGYTTNIIRPAVVKDLALARAEPQAVLEASQRGDKTIPGTDQVDVKQLPETVMAPGYPTVLAVLLSMPWVSYESDMSEMLWYSPELTIVLFNFLLIGATSLLLYHWATRMFNERVALLAALGYLLCGLTWDFALSGLSTILSCFLLTAVTASVHEALYRAEEGDEKGIWVWSVVSAVALAALIWVRMSMFWLVIPYAAVMLTALRLRPVPAGVSVAVLLVAVLPLFVGNFLQTGSVAGSAGLVLEYKARGVDDFGNFAFRNLLSEGEANWVREFVTRIYIGLSNAFNNFFPALGSNFLVIFAIVGLLHPFKRFRSQWTRALIGGFAFFALVGQSVWCVDPKPLSDSNSLFLVLPGLCAAGAAFFYVMLDRLHFPSQVLRTTTIVAMVALCATPLLLALFKPGAGRWSYPPYFPPFISFAQSAVTEDELMMSDVPEAVAWYGQHPCVPLPATLEDFFYLHDRIHPVHVLVVTPATINLPFSELARGREKAWGTLATGGLPSRVFPLAERTRPSQNLDYVIYSDLSLGLRIKSNQGQ